jgi:uncharacterized protein
MMKCPNCDSVLSIAERFTVEIDYCPSCRGVWLDKGELDKIINLANQQSPSFSKRDDEDDYKRHFGDKDRRDNDYKGDRGYYEGKNKKKSFLSDLFDF